MGPEPSVLRPPAPLPPTAPGQGTGNKDGRKLARVSAVVGGSTMPPRKGYIRSWEWSSRDTPSLTRKKAHVCSERDFP